MDSLGEYKVVVSADYSQLQDQMKKISQLMNDTASVMTTFMSSATKDMEINVNHAMDNIAKSIERSMTSIQTAFNNVNSLKLDNIKLDTSGLQQSINEAVNGIKTISQTAENVKRSTENVSRSINETGKATSKSKGDFESYAKQISNATVQAEKLHQEIQKLKALSANEPINSTLLPDMKARLADTQNAFDSIRQKIDQLKKAQADYNNSLNKTELIAKEHDKTLQQEAKDKEQLARQNAKLLEGELKFAQEQQAQIDKENEKRQRQITSLDNAYKRLYANIESYMATNTQMAERQFHRYQTALTALQAKMQGLGVTAPTHAIQGMSYASYSQPFKDNEAETKRVNQIRKLGEEYERVYRNINSYIETNTKMSARQFHVFNENINRLRQSVVALGQTPNFRNPLEGMNYAEYARGFDTVSAAVANSNKQTGFFIDTLKSLKHHMTWMFSGAVMMTAFGIPAQAVRTISEVEKEMAGFKQVNHEANESQEVLNATTEQFINIAQRYGMSVDEIIKAGVLWGRGYKNIDTVMQLTSVSAKLAVADMMDVSLANRAVESVINSFQMQGEAVEFANHVVDSWTKVAHNAQSSAKDLADAMMRSAAAAKAVGVDFDTATALASTMIKTTGLAGATIGESMKSLFSSIHSKKAIQSLNDLGIEVYKFDEDGTRHFRSVQAVLIDLMTTSHTTSRNMEKDLLAISGGKPKLAA